MRAYGLIGIVIVTAPLLLCPSPKCHGTRVYVPPAGSIQAAIDTASPGDTVVLGPGEYFENIRMKDHLALAGSGPDVTVLRSLSAADYSVVYAASCVEVRGLTIADGEAGLYLSRADDSIVSDCAFVGNGAGLILVECVNFLVQGSAFTGNSIGVHVDHAQGEVRDCDIHGNKTGVFSVAEALPRISASRISCNLWGLDVFEYSRPDATNCIFRSNGIAIRSEHFSETRVTNCTFWLNIYALRIRQDYPASIIVSNSIIWASDAAPVDLQSGTGTVQISYSDVERGWPGPYNIDADPMFVGPFSLDFRLQRQSPCVDVGNNSTPDLPENDLAGRHRTAYGGKSFTVDMGPYELYINKLEPVLGTNEAIFTWSSLADKTYSIFYSSDLFNWHTAIDNFPSFGNETTSWLDDGSLTGIPPLLAPKRFYRLLENP